MVKGGNLKILIPLAIIASAVTVGLYQRQQRGSAERFEARKLVSGLDIGSIRRVVVDSGGAHYELQGTGQDWSLDSLPGYPIDKERLRELVLGIGNLEVSDRMTRKPENYERMGVQDEKPAGGHVKLLDKDDKVLADLFVGDERRGKPSAPGGFSPADGQYVRLAGDPWVYTTGEVLTIDNNPNRWLDKQILKVDPSALQSVHVDDPGTTESFTLTRSGPSSFKLDGPLPGGMKVKDWAVDNVARAIANLTANDVISATDDQAAALKFDGAFIATQKNGLAYRLGTAESGEKRYLRVAAKYEPAFNLGLSDERTSDTVQARAMGDPQVSEADINQRHNPWVYEISDFIYGNLAKKRSELLEPETPPQAADLPDMNGGAGPRAGAGGHSDDDIESFLGGLQNATPRGVEPSTP